MTTVTGIFKRNTDTESGQALHSIGLNEEYLGLLARGAPDDAVEKRITH